MACSTASTASCWALSTSTCESALSGHTVAYVGTLWGSLCDPRGIYAPALLVNAAYVAMFHTHPSGNPNPSPEDQAMTERVAAAGKVLAIPLLDHLILGESPRYVSLAQLGRMP